MSVNTNDDGGDAFADDGDTEPSYVHAVGTVKTNRQKFSKANDRVSNARRARVKVTFAELRVGMEVMVKLPELDPERPMKAEVMAVLNRAPPDTPTGTGVDAEMVLNDVKMEFESGGLATNPRVVTLRLLSADGTVRNVTDKDVSYLQITRMPEGEDGDNEAPVSWLASVFGSCAIGYSPFSN